MVSLLQRQWLMSVPPNISLLLFSDLIFPLGCDDVHGQLRGYSPGYVETVTSMNAEPLLTASMLRWCTYTTPFFHDFVISAKNIWMSTFLSARKYGDAWILIGRTGLKCMSRGTLLEHCIKAYLSLTYFNLTAMVLFARFWTESEVKVAVEYQSSCKNLRKRLSSCFSIGLPTFHGSIP